MDLDNISKSSFNRSLDSNSVNTSITAKMRRLKIKEDLLLKSIKKNLPLGNSDSESNFIKSHLEFKKFVSRLRKADADIKQLFEDVKCTTKSNEILKTLDIDDVKKDDFDLEEKIKSFKTFLQREHAELKKSEKDLIKQLEDNNQVLKTKKYTKLTTKTFSDIIPSPVKNIINSPFKCPEVQQFQDFISNSHKHGGWHEYNHNIFIRIWKNHFPDNESNYDVEKMDNLEKEIFIDEVFDKVSGVKRNEIISHMKWYTKYLCLKKRQQIALDEWRAKTKPKKAQNIFDDGFTNAKGASNNCDVLNIRRNKSSKTSSRRGRLSDSVHYFSDDSNKYSTTKDQFQGYIDANDFYNELDYGHASYQDLNEEKIVSEFRFMRSTKQWENRCNSAKDLQANYKNVDDIRKLGIPSWRQGLEEKE